MGNDAVQNVMDAFRGGGIAAAKFGFTLAVFRLLLGCIRLVPGRQYDRGWVGV